MNVHFVWSGGSDVLPTGQNTRVILAFEGCSSSLLSFAHASSESKWRQCWQELVRIHLAGLPSQNKQIQSAEVPQIESHLTTYADLVEVKAKEDAMRIHLATTCHEKRDDSRGVRTLMPEEEMNQSLFSYAYEDHEKEWAESRTQPTLKGSDLRPRVIIDSGAFTAWTTGKAINPKDYADWALNFDSRWRHQMASLEFMNLDVIGDQDATWQNQSILEGLGMKPMPIVTYGVDLKHLDGALEQYDYIALGGLVPYTRQKDKLQRWLDACFSRVMAYRKKTGILRRIHLLGVTTDWVLKKYPCYSSDSSSWVSCLRFGGGKAAGIKQLPRYKESDGAMAATIHTLRSEIRKYKKMEQEATNLWKSRGVVFND